MRCSVVFGVTLRFLVINISSSSAINTAAYYQQSVTTCATMTVVHRRPCWQHLAVAALTAGSEKARYRLRIAISTYPTCIRRPRWGGGGSVGILLCRLARKTRMVWLRDGEKISKISLFIFTECTNVTDTQTDRHRTTAKAALMHSIAR